MLINYIHYCIQKTVTEQWVNLKSVFLYFLFLKKRIFNPTGHSSPSEKESDKAKFPRSRCRRYRIYVVVSTPKLRQTHSSAVCARPKIMMLCSMTTGPTKPQLHTDVLWVIQLIKAAELDSNIWFKAIYTHIHIQPVRRYPNFMIKMYDFRRI